MREDSQEIQVDEEEQMPSLAFALCDAIKQEPARLGWGAEFAQAFKKRSKKGWQAGLVLADFGISAQVLTLGGEIWEAAPSGQMLHHAQLRAELPSVGDWVLLNPVHEERNLDALMEVVLPRRSRFSRKVPGKSTAEQVLAANVDWVLLVTDAAHDWNLRRLERYAALAKRGGVRFAVVVNKADLVEQEVLDQCAQELDELGVESRAQFFLSALEETGLEPLRELLQEGVVASCFGSSGVGKSTLLNALLGEEVMETGEIHEASGQGKHTTTIRRVLLMPKGALLIDNPGTREVQLWCDAQTLRESFADIAQLALQCEFANCKHQGDRGCALQAAAKAGTLSRERFGNFLRLDEEIEKLEKQQKGWQRNYERVMKRELKNKFRNKADRFDESID